MAGAFGKTALLAAAISLPIALSGCQTTQTAFDNDCKTGGAITGAALGGLAAGLFLGKGTGKLATVALGAALGSVIGQQIGSMLDCRDQKAVESKTVEAVNTAKDGETVTWSNPETGATAEITPQATRTETRKVALVRDKKIAALPKLELIGETWETVKSANLRSAPSTDAHVLGGLAAGQTFNAVGKVEGSDWIVAAQGKRTIGYIYAPLVRKAATPVQTAAQMRPAVDLDAVEQDRAVDLDAETTVTQEVVAASTCRTMDVKVANKAGENGQEQMKACKGADGAWEIL